ncbi:MAG: transaldolase family protein [Spirochaetia bacterium]
MKESYRSPLHKMVSTTPTCLWNDSCSIEELSYSIGHGAVGATCNPVIVGQVLRKEMHLWKDRIPQIIAENPCAADSEIAWKLTEEMSKKAAELLLPIFDREEGRNGRLSIQTDPRLYRDAKGIVEQAVHLSKIAPNIIVKIPVTAAGIEAIEEATARGVSINATVSFSVPQAVAVAEAVERGLGRRGREGKDIVHMGPVCTIMVGRLDDWLRVVAEKEGTIVDPRVFDWAGVAAMKKAYAIYRQKGYRLRLLSAAFRNHLHWSEFIGGEVVISPPCEWQKRFNASDVEVKNRMSMPVDEAILDELCRKFAEFRKAYDVDGMSREQFDTFGATRRTLRAFCKALDDLVAQMRDMMLPNPDV